MQSPHASTAPINKPPHATQARILDDGDALPQTAFVHEVHALAEWNACPNRADADEDGVPVGGSCGRLRA
jgi:hypothetical protein